MTALDRSFIKAFAETSPDSAARAVGAQTPAVAAQVIASGKIADALRGTVTSPEVSSPGTAAHAAPSGREVLATKSAGPLAPLSSFSRATVADEPVRAMLEVDRLEWPEACDGLLTGARGSWDHFADHISRQISQGNKCIAIVSCARGEGRTTVTLSTARHLSARGLRPLVVDADFEHPSVASRCGVSAATGWGDVLEGTLPLGEALIVSLGDGVTLMPWRGPARQAAQLSATPRIADHFRTLQDQHDLVLLDTMPLKNQTDVSDLASLARAIGLQAVYLIHDVRFTTLDQLTNTCARLRRESVNVAGIIENFLSKANPSDLDSDDQPPTAAGRTLAAYG